MLSPDWLTTDPIPQRTKGWVNHGPAKVTLKQAYMSPEVGAGQEGPPPRDDWWSAGASDPPSQAGGGLENEPSVTPQPVISPPPEAAPSSARDLGGSPDITPVPQAAPAPKPQPAPSAQSGADWSSSVTDVGEVGPHDHSNENPAHVNQIPPAGAQLAGDGTWLSTAETQLGRTYVWGGKDPKTGFDCSGYASWIRSQRGLPNIGASTMTMYPNTVPVSDPQPGDLVFYNMNTPDPHLQHVAVYIGNGKVIQSGGTKNTINIADATQDVGSAPEFRRGKNDPTGGGGTVGSVVSDQPDRAAASTRAQLPTGPSSAPAPAAAPVSAPPAYPTDSKPTEWFSYVDSGQEVMKITWDNGQTTYHVLGPTGGESSDNGTVLNTGSLDVGAGAEESDSGDGGSDTEWPIPSRDDWNVTPTGSAPTTTPAPQPPTRDDWSRLPTAATSPTSTPGSTSTSDGSADSSPSAGTASSDQQSEWPVPPSQPASSSSQIPSSETPPASSPDPATDTASPTPTASATDAAGATTTDTSTSGNQTEWQIPDLGQTARNVWSGVTGTVGGAASAVTQKAGELVAAPGGSTPGASQPLPSDALTNPPAYAARRATSPEEILPDISETLQAPDPGTPLGQVVQAGVRGVGAPATTQLAAVPGLVGGQMAAQETATQKLNPARDVPVLGGLINQSTSPENWFPVERALGPVAGAAKKFIPEAVGAAVDNLWDPATHTFGAAWDRLMPDAVASRVPANTAGRFAVESGVGAAAGGGYYATHPDDPNRVGDSIAVGTAGLIGSHVAADVIPATVDAISRSPIGSALKETFSPVDNLKSAAVRDAVVARGNRINSSHGENWMWQNRIEQVFGKPGKGYNTVDTLRTIEETGAPVPGMNAEQQQLVHDMLSYVTDTGDEGRRLGYIRGDITTRPDSRGMTLQAYMPRVYDEQLNAAKQAPGAWHGRINPKDYYTRMRQHVSIYDAQQAGLDVTDSISKAFGHYAEHVNASRANALFVKDLKKMAPETIQRVPRMSGTGSFATGSIPKGWTPGRQFMPQWQAVAFAPELNTVLHNITEPGIQNKIFRTVSNLQAEAKYALFAPSMFHLGNEIRQVYNAAGRDGLGILPKTAFFMIPGAGKSAARKFWANPSVMADAKRAMDAGLTLMRRMPDAGEFGMSKAKAKAAQAAWGATTAGAAGYMDARFDPTLTEEQRLQRGLEAAGIGAVGGALGGTLSHALWEDAVPYMKLMTWSTLEPKFGEEAAARFVNSVYGGQNLEAIARSRKMQDIFRLVALAPDWQEGWIRQIGNALLPGAVGDMNRQYWARAAVTSAFMLEGFNMAINGHPTVGAAGMDGNGPGHEFTLETTGLYDRLGWDHTDTSTGEKYRTYVDLLGPYRGLINAPLNPGSFLSARQGLVPQELATAATGKDWRGKDIAPPGSGPWETVGLRAAYALSRLAPVGPAEVIRTTSQQTNEPLPLQVGLGVAGLRETRQSPLQLKVQQRDQTYRDLGVSQDQEQEANTVYQGLISEAARKTADAFDPSAKHTDIVNKVQQVDWPNRTSIVSTLEPEQIASDPVKNADWVAKMQGIGPIGTSSSSLPADVEPGQVDLNTVSSVYWNPPGMTAEQLAKLPPVNQDRARESALVQYALAQGLDPNALKDAMKAQSRGEPLPPLRSITSSQLDDWVTQYRAINDPDPQIQAQKRRDFVDQTAAEHNQDPGAVYQRIKMRYLPLVKEDPNEPGIAPEEKQKREMEVSYERATDVLHDSKDPAKYPRYAGPDGKPYKGSSPTQWAQWDDQIKGATTAQKKNDPNIRALVQAQSAGEATRLKAIYGDQQSSLDYQRWYGVGRNMDEAHWQDYVKGTGGQFTDVADPTETQRRNRTLLLWKATAPDKRRTTNVKIKLPVNGQVREETVPLDDAKKYIERNVNRKWLTESGASTSDLGLDTTGTVP